MKGLLFFPGAAWLCRRLYRLNDPRLEREVFGIRFSNPVGVAAGFDKEAGLYGALSCFGFGHVEVGTVTPLGQKGNPKPRLFRLPEDQALINRMGFNNKGLKTFVRKLKRRNNKLIVGGNIGKNTQTPAEEAIADYCRCFEALFELVDYFTVNVSCPNIAGLQALQDKEGLLELLNAIQRINRQKPKIKPVLLKISPDLNHSQLDDVIGLVRKTGLDGIVATNTSTRREGLTATPEKVKRIGKGGLSGRPLRDKSTHTIAYLHEKGKGQIPIVGVGGILTPKDALEKLAAGASLVQVYTGFVYYGPSLAKNINAAILRNA